MVIFVVLLEKANDKLQGTLHMVGGFFTLYWEFIPRNVAFLSG